MSIYFAINYGVSRYRGGSKLVVFISYSDKNRVFAEDVARELESRGHTPFLAYRDMVSTGETWLKKLYQQVEQSELFVMCLDATSVDAKYQQIEWEWAVHDGKPIVVVGLCEPTRQHLNKFPTLSHYHVHRFEDRNERNNAFRAFGLEFEEQFEFIQNLCVEAGMRLMRYFGLRYLIGTPDPLDNRRNYATEIDAKIDEFIRERIVEEYPNDTVLSEERKDEYQSDLINSTSGLAWTIDPLDGTLNYISGDDRFCCGIGLMEDGVPVLGTVFCPTRMELYTGGKGRFAERRLINEGSVERLKTEAADLPLEACNTLTHINSEAENLKLCFQRDFPQHLHASVRRVWMWGCGLLGLIAIARGSHHLFVQRKTYPWDVVPGLAIIQSAGGAHSTWPARSPDPWSISNYQSAEGILACSNDGVLTRFFERFADK